MIKNYWQKYVFCKVLIIFFVFLFSSTALYAQEMLDEPENIFDEIDAQKRYIENLVVLATASEEAYNMPLGIRGTIENIPLTLAITNVKLGENYGEISLMAKIELPQQSRTLIFGASDIRISNAGDLIGDVKLTLLKDVPLPVRGVGKVVFKGGIDSQTGASISRTYVMLDCNGNFKELSIDGEVVLDSATYRLANAPSNSTDLTVRAFFGLTITDLNDLLVELSLPEFERIDLPGFSFLVENAVLDLSDKRNAGVFTFPENYKTKGYFTLPEDNLWGGLYVEKFKLTFPKYFVNKCSNLPPVLMATNLLIDENGFTASISGKDILDLGCGSADGWMFSVTEFKLAFLANHIIGLGFSGHVGLGISETVPLCHYEAYLSDGYYFIKGSPERKLPISLFNVAEATLEPSSYLQLEVIDRTFVPTIVLDGTMQLKADVLNMGVVEFEQLAFSTRSPFLKVKSMGYRDKVNLAFFPVTISDIQLSIDDYQAQLGMDMRLNLMDGRIAASTKAKVFSERKNGLWKFKNLDIEKIILENIELSGFSLNGIIELKKDDPVYGDCFGGKIKANIGALSGDLTVDVEAMFGTSSFRYWYVEGSTVLPNGIPVAGGLSIDGFAGGIYYKVSRQSGAYVPDSRTNLGIKAGASLYMVKKNLISANALFEINFLSTGGIKNIAFYAQANFLGGASSSTASNIFDAMRNNMTDMGQSMANTSTDVAKVISSYGSELTIPDKVNGVKAYAKINLDFVRRELDANFRVLLNVVGGLIQGSGSGYDAGAAQIYISPSKWYVKVGTPNKPIGIKIGIRSLSVDSKSYIMFGYIDETPLPPDAETLRILGNVNSTIFSSNYGQLQGGSGVAFGSRVKFDTGTLRFLFLEGRFQAGGGFDILFRNMENCICEGIGPMGINDWYAQGQFYAYLSGRLGARIKLFGIKKTITIISAGMAALLEAQSPNPTWVGGQLGLELNILGIIKGKMNMKVSIGDKCKVVTADGTELLIDFPIISDVYPANNAVDIDVFSNPQVTLAIKNREIITSVEDDGSTQKFRATLTDFSVTDKDGKKLEGTIKWNTANDVATLEIKEVLPTMQQLRLLVEVSFEEYKNGKWETYRSASGIPYKEIKDIFFKSGAAPDHIPYSNVSYMYPVVGQKNMYPGEHVEGYVQLKKGQSYLFIDNFVYNATLKASGEPAPVNLFYDRQLMKVSYTIPKLLNSKDYKLNFTAAPSNVSNLSQINADAKTQTQSYQIEGLDEDSEMTFEQKLAEKFVREGSLILFECDFRTSQYNTFVEKLNEFTLTDMRFANDYARSLLLRSSQPKELFDEIELKGSEYSKQPLVSLEAVPEDAYYKEDIAPLLYNWSLPSVSVTQADNRIYGIPPLKAFTFYPNYLNVSINGGADDNVYRTFPYMYDLPLYYNKHYNEMRAKAINEILKAQYDKTYKPYLDALTGREMLFMRKGYYRVVVKYTLPGAESSAKRYNLDYFNELDWGRK